MTAISDAEYDVLAESPVGYEWPWRGNPFFDHLLTKEEQAVLALRRIATELGPNGGVTKVKVSFEEIAELLSAVAGKSYSADDIEVIHRRAIRKVRKTKEAAKRKAEAERHARKLQPPTQEESFEQFIKGRTVMHPWWYRGHTLKLSEFNKLSTQELASLRVLEFGTSKAGVDGKLNDDRKGLKWKVGCADRTSSSTAHNRTPWHAMWDQRKEEEERSKLAVSSVGPREDKQMRPMSQTAKEAPLVNNT